MKKIWSIRKDGDGVSPVIATILMVAITVVLAAVLYVMVLGIGGPGDTGVNIGVNRTSSGDGVYWIVTVSSVSDTAPTSDFYVKIVNTTGDQVVYKLLSTYTSGTEANGVTWINSGLTANPTDSTIDSGDYFKLVKGTSTDEYPANCVFSLLSGDNIAAQVTL